MKIFDLKRIISDGPAHSMILVPGQGPSDGFWVIAQEAQDVIVEEVEPGRFIVDTSDREFWELKSPRRAIIIC